MNTHRHTEFFPSEDDRELLRSSTRGWLQKHWPPEQALDWAKDPGKLAEVWNGLAGQGLGSLGTDRASGGLREILVVAEELGRAACPVSWPGVALANLALAAHNTIPAVADLLAMLAAGQARVGYAFGAFDNDPHAGWARLTDGVLSGTLTFVEGALGATHLLIALDQTLLGIIDARTNGVMVTPTPGLSVPPLAQVRCEQVPAICVNLTQGTINDLNLVTRLIVTARALGAARRGFEMAVEYAKQRQQFGQPIGRFQAIQHKLADAMTDLEGTRLTLAAAARSYDFGDPQWALSALSSIVFASPALRQVTLEAHHIFAAIGYAEEHEMPRHFRRVHGDLVRFGGVLRAREQIAAHVLDKGQTLPEYDLGEAGNAFRQEVRAWLAKHWKNGPAQRERALPFEHRHHNFKDPEYMAELSRTGWRAMAWPKIWGGQARSPLEQLALMEEFQRAGAPMVNVGEIQAFALMQYGSERQKTKFLPGLRSGEIRFCLGYSEPGAGSDLASLKTRAERDGDEWVINGQKIWTTGAEYAQYMWLAARTDPAATPPHAGISVFIVPMDAPGLSVRPSMAMYGHTFCSEFLDDVRIPADALVGPLHDGWKVLTSALATERIMMGSNVTSVLVRFEQLVEIVRELSAHDGQPLARDRAIRDRIGQLAAEIEVARQLLITSIQSMEQGRSPIHEAAMSKVYTAELMQRLPEAALDIIGTAASLAEAAPGAISDGCMEQLLRHSIMYVVGGGTAQIQRNLIAQRGLGLPR